MPPIEHTTFDFPLAAANFQKRIADRKARRLTLYNQARQDCRQIVDLIVAHYAPRRIYQWGSLLHPDQFDENSDIDLAVEGLASTEDFFRLFGEAMRMTDFTLDLLEYDKLTPMDRQTITSKGIILYERHE